MPFNPHTQNCQYEEKLRDLLVNLAALYRKADIYTLFSICNDMNIESLINALRERGYIEEYEVKVFNTDFTCYGVTRDGYEYLKIHPRAG